MSKTFVATEFHACAKASIGSGSRTAAAKCGRDAKIQFGSCC